MVPALYRNAEGGIRSGGFPIAFQILAGTAHSTNVVASFSAEDHQLPRIAPLAVPIQPIQASWVAIEATTLSSAPGVADDNNLQLSEIMVFSGMENVALPLKKTLGAASARGSRLLRYLTDGFTPFLMNAAQGSSSQSKVIRIKSPTSPLTIMIDLNASQPVHQINLHTADVTLSIPMVQFSCWAVPRHIRITGSNRPDFADETFLCEYNQQSIFDNGPIIMRRFPEARCRYIRLEILDPQSVVPLTGGHPPIAFSEIEVLSKNKNIAQGAPITASSGLGYAPQKLGLITDGLNYYGSILPLRDWMNQLARRHDLETERPLVAVELNRRYARQQTNLRLMSWLAALLAAGTGFSILFERVLYLRKMQKTRIRFAADLHDELGANVHTIGLLSDAATVARDSADEWQMLHQRIRKLTERTGTAIRHVSDMINADGLYLGLVEDMQRASERIMAKFENTIKTNGEEFLGRLKPRARIDVFLFYKECLMNICRHSEATRFDTQLTASPKEIVLTIRDNGKGLPGGTLPASLKRRARLLKAKLSAEESPGGGTKITLRLRNGRKRRTMRHKL